MRHVKITGGPFPRDIKIVDVETGADLTAGCHALKIWCDTRDPATQLVRVELTMFAQVDLVAEIAPQDPPPGA